MSDVQAIDAVGKIVEQWKRERPDLDVSPMGVLGRLQRSSKILTALLTDEISKLDLEFWEFDMLSTLRRAGTPFILSPTQMFSTLMITSGTMTHRLKRLEQRGLISRKVNEEDSRSMLVCLTKNGKDLIDEAIEAHLANEKRIISNIPKEKLHQLDELLAVLLKEWE